MTGTCQGCGTALTPSRGPHPRKWCSDQCRKHATYVRHCIDCGTRLSSSDGNGPNAPVRCVACNNARRLGTGWTAERITVAIRDWNDHFGAPPSAMDWNPKQAIAHGCQWKADRYYATGRKWPSVWTVQALCGSWNAALEAAGFRPRRTGDPRPYHEQVAA